MITDNLGQLFLGSSLVSFFSLVIIMYKILIKHCIMKSSTPGHVILTRYSLRYIQDSCILENVNSVNLKYVKAHNFQNESSDLLLPLM